MYHNEDVDLDQYDEAEVNSKKETRMKAKSGENERRRINNDDGDDSKSQLLQTNKNKRSS